MSTRWYYAKAGTNDRQGPVSVEQVHEKLRSGELNGNDIVWRPGLPQWAPIHAMPELGAAPSAPPAPRPPPRLPPTPPPPLHGPVGPHSSHHPGVPTAQPAPQAVQAAQAIHAPAPAEPVSTAASSVAGAPAVGYFTPGADMPTRARENLAKYAKGTGPIGDWPLSDAHVVELATAVKYRKRILGASNAAMLIFAVQAILAIVYLAAGLTGRSRDLVPMLIAAAVALLFAILFLLAARAMKYCKAWGSLVTAILASISLVGVLTFGALGVVGIGMAPGARFGEITGMILGLGFAFLINLAFVIVFWRGWAATGTYLDSPLWCQEALAVAEKAK